MVALVVGDSIHVCARIGRHRGDGTCAGIYDGHEVHRMVGVGAVALRRRSEESCGRRRRLAIVPVALLTFYVVNPSMWHDPLEGLKDHFHRNLDRAQTFNISTQFLGDIYNVAPSPGNNTLVWLVFVTPLPTLALGVIGLWQCLVKRTAGSVFPILYWVTLMADARCRARHHTMAFDCSCWCSGSGACSQGLAPSGWSI